MEVHGTMNVKTFKADSLMEALRRVHGEFGEDARIIHTREIEEKRFFGLRRHRFVEITAAEALLKRNEQEPDTEPVERDDTFLRQLQKSPYEVVLSPPIPSRLRTEADPIEVKNRSPVPTGLWRRMVSEQLNPSILQRSLIARFEEMVRFDGPIDLSDGKRKIVALLGPTGVGKTATLAKIAAHYRLKEFKRVGFITTDTYRVAAVEQFAQYAEMLDCPVETVSEPFRMKTVLTRFSKCDLVLLDTPGTNPKNVARLQTLAAMLDAATVDETHLILSSTGSAVFLLEMLRRFEPLAPTHLTLTKTDEAVGPADLYRFFKENNLPLRFLTTGQNISEDIEVAGPARLASLA